MLAQSIVGHAAHYGHLQVRHLAELERIVRLNKYCLGEVFADLVLVDVDSRSELYIADVVPTEASMHQARYELVVRGVLVVLYALHERGCAVAYTYDRYPDLLFIRHFF